jgi:hypothetical protein
MKSKTRNVLIVLVVLLVAGLGGAAALVFSSGFQTWAFRRAVAGVPGMTIDVASVEAGLSQARLTGLKVTMPGMVVTADSADATLSAWNVITTRRADLGTVNVRNAVVDLRGSAPVPAAATPAAPVVTLNVPGQAPAAAPAPAPAPKAAAAAPARPVDFNGLLAGVVLSAEFSVAKLAANVRVLLPEKRTASVTVNVADLGTGRRGKLDWKIDVVDPADQAAVSAVRASGTATVTAAADGRVTALETEALAAFEGPGLPSDRLSLKAKATPTGAAGDETYEVTAGLERGAQVETVLEGRAQFAKATRSLAGTWKVAARSEQFAALLSGLGLPTLAATGGGKFNFEPAAGTTGASGELDVAASDLGRLSPGLRALSAVKSHAAFDVNVAGGQAVVQRLELNLSDAAGRRLADVAARQRITVNLADQQLSLENPAAELARVSVQKLPVAWLQPWVKDYTLESGDLSLALAVEAGTDGSRVRARAAEPVLVQDLSVRQAGRLLLERATISVRPDIEYTAARISAALADLRVTIPAGDSITGSFTSQVTGLPKSPVVDFTTELAGRLAEGFRRQVPELPAAVRFTASAQGRLAGDELQVAKYSITVNQDTGPLLAAVDAAQPFKVDLAKGTFAAGNPAAPAIRARLGELPLAWIEPYEKRAKLAGSVSGGAVELTVGALDDITVAATAPLGLRNATVSWNGQALVQNLDMVADFTATRKQDRITYDVRRLEAKQGDATLLRFNAAGSLGPGDKLVGAAKGVLEVPDAGALSRQPALAAGGFTRGSVAASFDAKLDGAGQVTATITTRNLTSRQAPTAPLNLDSTFTAVLKPDGSGTIKLPLTLTAGPRKTDVTIDGAFTQPAGGYAFTGKISSTQANMDDLMMLTGLVPSTGPATPAPAGRSPASGPAAAGPFWKGMTGRIEADLKNVQSGAYVLSGLRGTLQVTDNRIAVSGLEGTFRNNNPFKLSGNLDYAATQARPYVLAANVDVAGLDVGEILRQANPNERPAVETKVNVTGRIAASATQPDGLLENLTGQFDAAGSAGTLRALGKKGEAVNLLGTALGIFGAVRGSDNALAASQLAAELNELRFEKFSVKVVRGADLNLQLSALDFVSPIMHLTGKGQIIYRAGVPIDQQPLELQLQLGSKEQLAQLMNRAGMLDAAADANGYFPLKRPFVITGTAAKPDSAQLWRMITEAGLGAAGLLGR